MVTTVIKLKSHKRILPIALVRDETLTASIQ